MTTISATRLIIALCVVWPIVHTADKALLASDKSTSAVAVQSSVPVVIPAPSRADYLRSALTALNGSGTDGRITRDLAAIILGYEKNAWLEDAQAGNYVVRDATSQETMYKETPSLMVSSGCGNKARCIQVHAIDDHEKEGEKRSMRALESYDAGICGVSAVSNNRVAHFDEERRLQVWNRGIRNVIAHKKLNYRIPEPLLCFLGDDLLLLTDKRDASGNSRTLFWFDTRLTIDQGEKRPWGYIVLWNTMSRIESLDPCSDTGSVVVRGAGPYPDGFCTIVTKVLEFGTKK